MYTTYSVHVLAELRQFAIQVSNELDIASHSAGRLKKKETAGADMRTAPVKIRTRETKLVQSTKITIVLVALLCVVLCLSLLPAARFVPSSTKNGRPVLRNAPGSIAAQMALLVGSELVRQLREEDAVSTKDTKVWDQRFRLGWWPVHDANGKGARDGMDGEDVGPIGERRDEHENADHTLEDERSTRCEDDRLIREAGADRDTRFWRWGIDIDIGDGRSSG